MMSKEVYHSPMVGGPCSTLSLWSPSLERTGSHLRRSGFNELVLTEFKSITRVLAMVVQVKRRIHVTDEESERSEDEEVNKVVASVQVPMYWYRMHASTWNCYMHEEGNWKMNG